MTLNTFLQHVCGITIHVGTCNGECWLYSDTAQNLRTAVAEDFKNREIVEIYPHDGREKSGKNCCELKAGLAVIIDGNENGNI